MKPISIIIPTLNEEHYLPRLLRSFVNQDFKGIYEVLVIDGHSTDKTAEVVKEYQKILPTLSIYQCDTGISKQRNYGAKKAKYDSLIFLDGDMELPKKTLLKLERHFQTKDNFIAIPALFPYDWKFVDIFLFILSTLYFVVVRYKNPILTGMCIITTKQVHNHMGGFNEKAIIAEDIEYGLRAHKNGARYYMLFGTLVRGSARRLNKTGRIKLGITWHKWYVETIKHGVITDVNKFNYEFGKFKKE
ncbi:MAG TPA: glycosyltransferase [Candidatus Saccharimonadales bacterium]|nr:glycosyltransferase [Candidatus Saccharimonadales bacterium]